MSLSSYGRSKGHAPARRPTMLLVATLMLTPHLAWGQDKTLDEAERLWAQGQELLHKGDPGGAENLFKRALAIREKTLGPEHRKAATRLNDLAMLYDDQGRCADAEPLNKRALAILEMALGPDHPDVATSLNNLAVTYYKQGRYADAEPLHKRALAIREKALGPDHPDVAASLHNLATMYNDQGRYADAEPLYKRA